jgi:NADH-quinone oxidoreductase subunit H
MDWLDYVIMAIKVIVAFGFLNVAVMLTIWAERRIVAFMQQRIGPNRVGPFGLLQTLADGVKLLFKEDITPRGVDRAIYFLAPLLSVVPAFMAFGVIPLGNRFRLGDRIITVQVADLNIGILYFLAMGSLMVYGVVLAGWSSRSAYPLLGAVRSTAQMISYELAMGVAVVSVTLYAGTLSLAGFVDAQAGTWFGFIPRWNIFPQLPAFLLFMVTAMAETNRAPFDLPEAETELVAGYHTEYSGIKFAMFFLAEYMHIITSAAIAVTLFLGGWRGWVLPFARPLWPPVWFMLKLGVLIFVFIWARATVPRFRYDRLMRLGWKLLVPAGIVWLMATAVAVVLPTEFQRTTAIAGAGIGFGVLTVWWLAAQTRERLPEIRAALAEETAAGKAG